MSTDVLMIDRAKFCAIMDSRIAHYKAKADVSNPRDISQAYTLIYNGAVASAISEVGQAIMQSSIVEKWD